MQAGEGDELPAVTQFAEAVDVRFLFGAGHGGFPVERGREVVGESGKVVLVSYVSFGGNGGNVLLFRPGGMHAVSELLGLFVVWLCALHPDHVGVRGV